MQKTQQHMVIRSNPTTAMEIHGVEETREIGNLES